MRIVVQADDVWQADIDNNGTIDYGEFLAATIHLNKLEREENLLSAFSYFDKDGSGFITIDELQLACKEFGLSDLHLDDMISEIDEDNVSFSYSFLILHFSSSFSLSYFPPQHTYFLLYVSIYKLR